MTTTTTSTQPFPQLEVTKTALVNDNNGSGSNDLGDKIVYTITINNIGNVNLSGLTISDTLTDGDGNSLGLTTSPTFVSATSNSTSSTIAINGILTYTAEFIIDQQSIDSGRVNNSVLVTASSPGNSNDVTDVSDDGNDSDGNLSLIHI